MKSALRWRGSLLIMRELGETFAVLAGLKEMSAPDARCRNEEEVSRCSLFLKWLRLLLV
jgi:hypothetical protein